MSAQTPALPARRTPQLPVERPLRLEIEYWPLERLKPDPKNPRRHSKSQLERLAGSMREFGVNVPVLAERGGRLIAGHARVLAAQMNGLKEMPVLILDHLSAAQARAFMIADNRLCELGTWDEATLAETLKDLSLAELDFDLQLTGFDMGEIDLRIQGLEGALAEEEPDTADELPEPGAAVTKAGDLWILGDRHRVYCGNALESESYAALLGEERAAIVFTDPPYNVRIAGHASGLGKVKHADFAMASGEMSEGEYIEFLRSAMAQLAAHTAAGSIHYLCADFRHLWEYLAAGRHCYSELKNICVWVKGVGGMGSLYRSEHEFVLVFKNGTAKHHNNVKLGVYGRNRTNVWRYAGINASARSTEEGNLLHLHPTVKPVRLIADALLDCSARGDLVLDAFLGSGSTVIAAERTGRSARAIELEPCYVDIALRRWQTYAGEEARHEATGRTFAELEAERGRNG